MLKPHFFPFLLVFIIFIVVGGIFIHDVDAVQSVHTYFPAQIGDVGWNGKYWLIVGNETHLIKYDGTNFSNVKGLKKFIIKKLQSSNYPNINQYGISQILWNNVSNYWLIHGYVPDYDILLRYNGENFNELSNRTLLPTYSIDNIEGNGQYYLMAVSGSAMTGETGGLVKIFRNGSVRFFYTSPDITSLLDYCDGRIIASNGTTLFFYNGKKFKKFLEPPSDFAVITVGYNGKYWLLGGLNSIIGGLNPGHKLAIYNKKNLSFISLPGDMRERVNAVQWGSNYWLVGTTRGLFRFDGDRIEKVGDMEVNTIGWNGKYYLISGDKKLVKYNGTLEDLTPKFLSALSAISKTVKASQGVKNQTTIKPQKPQKNYNNLILVIVAVLLFISVVYFIVRLKRR